MSPYFDFANKRQSLLTKGKEYDIYTEALHYGLETVFIQKGKVITYASYQLKDYETRT